MRSATVVLAGLRTMVGTVSLTSGAIVRTLERAADLDAENDSATNLRDRHRETETRASKGRGSGQVTQLPFFSQVEAKLQTLTRIAREERERCDVTARRFFAVITPQIADGLVSRLDLTTIVMNRLDIDRLVQQVDVDAVVRRVDLDAAVSRIDLEAIVSRIDVVEMARFVIEELELPEIIRESSGALAIESMEQLRVQSMRADRFVSLLLDRVVRKGATRMVSGPATTQRGSAFAAQGPQ